MIAGERSVFIRHEQRLHGPHPEAVLNQTVERVSLDAILGGRITLQ